MRSVNLLKIAAEAEILRQKTKLARQLRRAAFGLLALVFALGVLITAEIAAWQGRSVGAVDTSFSRAKQRIRQALEPTVSRAGRVRT